MLYPDTVLAMCGSDEPAHPHRSRSVIVPNQKVSKKKKKNKRINQNLMESFVYNKN